MREIKLNTKQTDCLKIISLNIERDRHFDRFIPFLEEHQPDIVLLQEVFAKDIAFLELKIKMKGSFVALNTFRGIENSKFGLLNLSTLDSKSYSIYYRGDGLDLPAIGPGEAANMARAILVTEFTKNNQQYCVINTHFTWTPDGCPSDKQYEDIDVMMDNLLEIPEFILMGDFNAPRGTPIFDRIASKYKDNIPPHVTTTIDKDFHKAGDLNLVVDGLFTTSKFCVNSVEVISGLSDHCAVLAVVSPK